MSRASAVRRGGALALLAIIVAGVVLLAGGGGTGTSAAVASAAGTTAKVAGADLTLSATVKLPARTVMLHGSGYESFVRRQATFSFSVPQLGQFTMRLIPPYIFFSPPAGTGHLPSGKRWVKLDAAGVARQEGFDAAGFSQQSDPAVYLSYLQRVANVSRVGSGTVDGERTTHYRATVDLKQWAAKVPATNRATAEATIKRFEALTGTTTIPVEVWVDRQKLIRRMRISLSLAKAGISEVVTIDLSHFGPKPPVAVPPAAETYTLPTSALKGSTG